MKAYPNSSLMPYIYRDYYSTYMALKNFAQTIEYADRMIALGDKIDTTGRLEAYYTRAQAFFLGVGADKTLQTPDALTKARDASVAGLKTVDDLKNPDAAKADQFEQQKKGVKVLFNAVAALASTNLKDYPAAAGYYKTVLSITPDDRRHALSPGHCGPADDSARGNRWFLGTCPRHQFENPERSRK